MDNVRLINPRDSADDDGLTRVPPQDLDTERAVLGGMILSPYVIPDVVDILEGPEFYNRHHETIYLTLVDLATRGEPVDPLSLTEALRKTGDLQRVGGVTYLHSLVDAVPIAANAPVYAATIRDIAARRSILTATTEVDQLVRSGQGDLADVIDLVREKISRATETSSPRATDATGWTFSDLTPVLDGTHKPQQPVVGARDDGIGLFYPGRVNGIQGESEAGKSWVALISCLVEINRGNHVAYLDFEDSEAGVVSRLLLIGANPDDIRQLFHYVRPGSTPTPAQLRQFVARIGDLGPSLIIVDGVTEAMVMMGLELTDNSEVAKFGRMLLRPLADTGAAVVPLDHVVKNNESRGRYALGGVHKLNAVDGVQYMLEAVRPFGINTEGRSRLRIAKDRPAQIRRHALPGGRNPMHWFADLVIRSDGDEFAAAHLYPPIQHTDDPQETAAVKDKAAQEEADIKDRETAVLDALAKATEPMSKNALEELIPGRASVTRRALTRLVHAGRVVTEQGPRKATLHRLPPKDGEKA
ncbi:DnaB-like helicase N-terminal domain-containing protein [Streptomyces sp. ME01-18h]|uniref:DnaB-like helicase N-terminal domain-containing protein n=1 Tax=Streptomyces sp. ME01-18h TaxID=462920 RepID=UPI0029A35206|nr:DnaB-like helicase N-terminal domain-containing protein [Streptomyces sp. ME01-18h]MDX3398406.1 DnaB-like helicase N-terminal domain-containing protein [Streptomyces sp. ME01-18h]